MNKSAQAETPSVTWAEVLPTLIAVLEAPSTSTETRSVARAELGRLAAGEDPDPKVVLTIGAESALATAQAALATEVALLAKYQEHLTYRSSAKRPELNHLAEKYSDLVGEQAAKVAEASVAFATARAQLAQISA